MKLIGEIFSLLAAICLCYSTFCKTKSKMLHWQIIDSLLNAISNIFLKSYSGAITNFLTAIRNYLQAKENPKNKIYAVIFCIIVLSLGILVNNKGWIGLFPILASIEYTIMMCKTKNVTSLKIALVINLFLWGTYDLYIKSYPMFCMDILIIFCSIKNIIKENKIIRIQL